MGFINISFLNFLVDHTSKQPQPTAVAYIEALISGAKPNISYTGERTFTHDLYEGSSSLDQLARVYLRNGRFDENAPLTVRLQHESLMQKFQKAYKQSDTVVASTWVAGYFTALRELINGRGCCAGVMASKFGSQSHLTCHAFEFSVAEFADLWPGQIAAMPSYDDEAGVRRVQATREMVEKALEEQWRSQHFLEPIADMYPQQVSLRDCGI